MEESYEGSIKVKNVGDITLSQFLDMWIERTYTKKRGLNALFFRFNIFKT